MKMNTLFKKIAATALAAAMLLTAAAGFGTQKVQAVSAHIISDEDATAVIFDDGSGTITCNKQFTSEDPLTEIDGVALKDIITFNDGGYIDQFYAQEDFHIYGDVSDLIDYAYPNIIRVHGCGPEGFGSGSGYLHFTDESNDTYDLSIWRHSEAWHYVKYGSDNPDIVKISWNS